jgi:hypothetical protein
LQYPSYSGHNPKRAGLIGYLGIANRRAGGSVKKQARTSVFPPPNHVFPAVLLEKSHNLLTDLNYSQCVDKQSQLEEIDHGANKQSGSHSHSAG